MSEFTLEHAQEVGCVYRDDEGAECWQDARVVVCPGCGNSWIMEPLPSPGTEQACAYCHTQHTYPDPAAKEGGRDA